MKTDTQEVKSTRKLQEDYRKYLLGRALILKIGIVHIRNFFNNKGGLTVAFRKSSPHSGGVMVECAVQVCSNKDTFSRKIGTTGALNRFFNGETIQLPILQTYSEEDMSHVVKQAFTVLYGRM